MNETAELQAKVANNNAGHRQTHYNGDLNGLFPLRSLQRDDVVLPQRDDVCRRTTVELDTMLPASGGETPRWLGSV